ncbi:NAD(P)/FAD-dependent oxidoreductase [Mucilaginibacter agri]|uniref:NADH:ubiquinone reductase (non-electrogenic) n=1 Tax=Mucilaginibacter agri TaxID=2695265 RepID=A0A965ZJ87_9SPHI|nr:NAD(P)/FAD-dependent oxidoreductase [Mucilaginibacter agri]NCD72120.1 FAD-dependent oxidoreductase [Mucilaginibacter agri]
MKIENNALTKVVIIGGGFAGLNLAMQLAKDKSYDITLVDKNNYNYFVPLLYQVATSFLEPSSISYPFRKLFRKNGVKFRLGALLKVEPELKTCHLDTGEITYDKLVFATGTQSNFFDMENIKKYAIPMKNIDDALKMRNALLKTLERASVTNDMVERKQLTTIVVAGGGPTGVEVAGMLAELRKFILAKDYPELKGSSGDIYIVDGGRSLLLPMSEKTHNETFDVLNNLGVKIILNTHVSDYQNGQVSLSTGKIIEARSLIWAAGVTANVFEGIPATSLGVGKRMITNEFNQVEGLTDVYAIGDACVMTTDSKFPKGHPQLAQPAIQQGQALAKNFKAVSAGKLMKPFIYNDKGSMAIIGRRYAVLDLLIPTATHLRGFPALFVWLFIHLMSLVNYRNKLSTFINWTVSYLTRDQALRMIFRSGD